MLLILLDSNRSGIKPGALQGVIRFVDHQSELLFGYDRSDLVGRHVEMLVPDSLWQVYIEHRDDYFADPRSRAMGLDLELRGRRRDGSEFPVTVSLSGIDTGGVLLEFSVVGNQTRRRQAFEAAQRMTAIVQNSDDAIIARTLEGTILSWNPGAERMFGYSDKEIIGRSIDQIEPQDRAGEIVAILARIKAGGLLSISRPSVSARMDHRSGSRSARLRSATRTG